MVPAATARLPVGQPIRFETVCDVAQQLRVDEQLASRLRRTGRPVVEQVEHPLAHHDVLPQRDGAMFVDHHRGVAAHRLDPAAELLGVAHRRRQTHQQHVVGQVQNHLFPYRAAHPVGQKMDLVHDDMGKSVQCRGIGVEHISQHFGGHHHDVGVAVDRLVTGEQADLLRTVSTYQIVVLLVAQRLDWRGVEALPARSQGHVHGELPHHRLTGAGRCADQDAVSALQRLARALLKVIQPKRQLLGEARQLGSGGVVIDHDTPPASARRPAPRPARHHRSAPPLRRGPRRGRHDAPCACRECG